MTRSLLEIIGLVDTPKHIPVVQPLVPKEPNGKQWGTPAYKYGLVYIYVTPEDRVIAKRLAKERGVSMKDWFHELMVDLDGDGMTDGEPGTGDDEIRVITSDKITVMKAGDFFEEFVFGPMERWEQLKKEKFGDKK
jgi:hypothetical protein